MNPSPFDFTVFGFGEAGVSCGQRDPGFAVLAAGTIGINAGSDFLQFAGFDGLCHQIAATMLAPAFYRSHLHCRISILKKLLLRAVAQIVAHRWCIGQDGEKEKRKIQ